MPFFPGDADAVNAAFIIFAAAFVAFFLALAVLVPAATTVGMATTDPAAIPVAVAVAAAADDEANAFCRAKIIMRGITPPSGMVTFLKSYQ